MGTEWREVLETDDPAIRHALFERTLVRAHQHGHRMVIVLPIKGRPRATCVRCRCVVQVGAPLDESSVGVINGCTSPCR